MILFFDTETTGKADFNASPDAPQQPRLVQLATLITDDEGTEHSSLNVIIRPDGYRIPQAASDIHGITTEMALKCGIDYGVAMQCFDQLLATATECVAHNSSFDVLIMSRGSKERAEKLNATQFCTMKAMTRVCKIPGPYGFKWPKLQEAYRHAFGKEFEGAHDALADVRACKDVFFWMKENFLA